ncbi:protein FAM184A-like [Asterias rubens]|uniref:protein FAM184A-like n=1 Tax=Asterias rubens TaxID=7604 RepID=UPI001455B3D1|nr:protein FAM184A-like [Asterias rubens]
MADGSGGSAAAATKFTRKSFEFKMSKKVAELTQVVHMLFVKNHEREVELEAVRAAYEEEISNVIADARAKLEKLKTALTEEQRRADVAKATLERGLEEKDKELSQRLAAADVKTQESERSNEFLREQVGRLQRIAESNEKNDKTEEELGRFQKQLEVAHKEILARDGELSRYREMVGRQTNKQEGNDAIVSQLKTQIDRIKSDLSSQISELKGELLETSNGKERLQQKNKNLELDLRSLRKELDSRRLADFNVQPQQQLTSPRSPGNMETNEELERLRREVRKYRMELSNREGNFNRMFTDSVPVRVDQRLGGKALARTKSDASMRAQMQVGNRTPRDSANNQQYRPGLNRLPTLSMDSRLRASNNRSGTNRLSAATPKERQAAAFSLSEYQ